MHRPGDRRVSGFPHGSKEVPHAAPTVPHSPVTLSRPRSENPVKPSTALTMPKTGSTVWRRSL